ncbi:TSUP family transporter [Denitratisoma sp. agr-D3]
MELLFLALAAFTAGFVDAVAGGGGLIQVPALLATLPGESPAVLFGTNKGASVFGSLNAAWRYGRRIAIPWRQVVLPATLAALVCAFCGAAAVAWISKEILRPLVLVLITSVLGYTLFKPDFGRIHGTMPARPLLPAVLIGGVIGFYDGFFGPGTGSFLIFAFIRYFGFDFLRASACAKVVNVATNVAALAFFIPHGQILWPMALVMAVCNITGAGFGSRLALKHGAGFVRGVFLLVTGALLLKIGFDTFFPA